MERTTFTLSVEEELTMKEAEAIMSDLEEVLGKRSLSLDESSIYLYGEE